MITPLDKSRLRLYLVLETSMLKIPLGDFMEEVIDGGVTAIQLRDKNATSKSRYESGLEIKKHFNKKSPLFIVNDRIDLALALKADGVHLGIKDIPLTLGRKIAPDLLFGYSCNTLKDCIFASKYADYAGIGPVYTTSTKKDLREVIGLEGLVEKVTKLSCPKVAIGGITLDNCARVIATGVDGVAISSYICSSLTPYDTVKSIIQKIS